jgi:hypothetical protein
MPLMSLSIPEPSISWYRVLPKPTALLHDHFHDPFAIQNSSLLQHHITSHKHSKAPSNTSSERRITVPSIAYSEIPKSSPSIRSPLRDSLVSIGNAYTDEGPVTRKRTASLMEGDVQSPDRSSHKEESGHQFCLCQPDPKIPRPRNGMCFCLCLAIQLLHAKCGSCDKDLYGVSCFVGDCTLTNATSHNSFHTLPPASPSCSSRKTSRPPKSRHLQNTWRTVEKPPSSNEKKVASTSRSR